MIVSKESFVRFVYPFLFDPRGFEQRARECRISDVQAGQATLEDAAIS